MPVPHTNEQFGDLLDIRFQKIFNDTTKQLSDMLPTLFTFMPDNGREDMRFSEVGAFADIPQITGSVQYD